jgi:hypothetical protein
MIVEGAKQAYVANVSAVRHVVRNGESTLQINHSTYLIPADSDDEAYGRAMLAAQAQYPAGNAFRDHFASVMRIDHIDLIRPLDVSKIVPVE